MNDEKNKNCEKIIEEKEEDNSLYNKIVNDNTFLNDYQNSDFLGFTNINQSINKTLIKSFKELKNNNSFEISNEKKDVSMILENKKVLDSTLKTIKLINNLNKTKQSLEKKLYFIHNNEEFLLNESFQKIPSLKIENNIRKANIQELKEKESVMKEKLNAIQNQIDLIIQNEKEKNFDRQTSIRNFLENFEIGKDNFQEKLKNIVKESNILRQKKLEDLNKSKKKKIEYLDKIEEEEKEKKIQHKADLKSKEIEFFQKRKKECEKLSPKIKSNLNKDKDYFFKKIKRKYDEEENKYKIKQMNERHIKYSNNYNHYNFDDFNKLLERKKIISEQESIERSRSMKEIWNNRAKLIPSFKSKLTKILEEEKKKEIEKFENEKIRKLFNYKEKKLYSENKIIIPERNNRLMKQLEERINKIKSKREVFVIPKDYSYDPKIKINETPKNKISFKKSFFKNNYNNNTVLSLKKNSTPRISKDDYQLMFEKLYFKNLINQNHKKESIKVKNNNTLKSINTNENKRLSKSVNTIIKKKNDNLLGDKIYDIEQLKYNADVLDKKTKNTKALIKCNGGFINNIEMGEKLNELMINSIRAKLNAINAIKGA